MLLLRKWKNKSTKNMQEQKQVPSFVLFNVLLKEIEKAKDFIINFNFFTDSNFPNWPLQLWRCPSRSSSDRRRCVCRASPVTTRAFLWEHLAWHLIRSFRILIWTSLLRWQAFDVVLTAINRKKASRSDSRRQAKPLFSRALLGCDHCFHRIHIDDFEQRGERLLIASLWLVLWVVVAFF